MSHCTKFDFAYTDEQLIVRAFRKMGIQPATGMVCSYSSDVAKRLSGFGYLGSEQCHAVIGECGPFQIFVCKKDEELFELFVEYGGVITPAIEQQMAQAESQFRKSYISAALDTITRKLAFKGIPSQTIDNGDELVLRFGTRGQYSLNVRFVDGKISEEVKGVKGSFCTALTEDFENLISHPEVDINTTWTQEYREEVYEQEIEVLKLTFG